jgi:hypothetical protein
MKLKAIHAHELLVGNIVRLPLHQTLYHLVTGYQIIDDTGGMLVDFDSGFYVTVECDEILHVLVSQNNSVDNAFVHA